MSKIACVYFSQTNVTGQLIQAAGETIEQAENEVLVHRICGAEIVNGRFVNQDLLVQLNYCDAIIFGSPTYMGGPAAQFKAFADATSDCWEEQRWAGKIAAGITSGSALNGDQGLTLQYFATLAAQHGMVWVGVDSVSDASINRLGCQLGATAHSPNDELHPADVATAQYLARRVATLARRLSH